MGPGGDTEMCSALKQIQAVEEGNGTGGFIVTSCGHIATAIRLLSGLFWGQQLWLAAEAAAARELRNLSH